MIQGQPLSATLPEDSGLGERFWYWRGASGRRYIHSIYRPDLCPPVPGAVFVVVSTWGGSRRAVSVGRFSAEGNMAVPLTAGYRGQDEIHVHLLARDEEGASHVLRDLLAALNAAAQPEAEGRPCSRPVQLDLLAA